MERFFWICLGGAAGTGLRYIVALWASERFGTAFPYGTVIVNVAGCFFMALLMHVALNAATFSPTLRLALTTGFLGGLTTYSSFNYETTGFLREGALSAAALNFGFTALSCFIAGLLGLASARWLIGA